MKIQDLFGKSPITIANSNMSSIGDVSESASGGGTGAGSVASLAGGIGGPMLKTIRRMPAGQSFFGPAGTTPVKSIKKNKKRK